MTTAAHTLLAKMWMDGLLVHHLTTAGPFLSLDDGARVNLTDEESSLFYLCTEHGGVLKAGDERCASHRNQSLIDTFIKERKT